MAGLVLATWSLERRRRKIDYITLKIYKINYKNRYFPIWDYASAEVIFAPAETSAVALGRRSRYRITTGNKPRLPSDSAIIKNLLGTHPARHNNRLPTIRN